MKILTVLAVVSIVGVAWWHGCQPEVSDEAAAQAEIEFVIKRRFCRLELKAAVIRDLAAERIGLDEAIRLHMELNALEPSVQHFVRMAESVDDDYHACGLSCIRWVRNLLENESAQPEKAEKVERRLRTELQELLARGLNSSK